MSEYNVASLNGKDYIEADTVNFRDNTYVFLVNEKDEKDFLVRKITSEGDKTFYDININGEILKCTSISNEYNQGDCVKICVDRDNIVFFPL